jgi:hypothetical protein
MRFNDILNKILQFSYYIILIFAEGGVPGRMVVGYPLPIQSVLITSEVVLEI